MTEALTEDLRSAVASYRRDGDDFHLLNWINLANALRCWREKGGGPGGKGMYFHFTPRKEND